MTTQKIHIAVLFGGCSGEHEVSLMSARSILNALNPDTYAVTPVGITRDGRWWMGENVLEKLAQESLDGLTAVTMLPEPGNHVLYALEEGPSGRALRPVTPVDVIFPVLHGTFGEDGTLQGLFEILGIAYVGAGVLGSAVGMDKALFKDVMRAYRLPVLDSMLVNRHEIETRLDEILLKAESLSNYPFFTKPANLGSSVGIRKCRSREELYQGLVEAARFDRRVMIERGIEARELEVSVLGNTDVRVSGVGEIFPAEEFYTYAAKYLDRGTRLSVPADLEEGAARRIQELARRAYLAVDAAGMARVDFLMEKTSGKVYISEINTIPGFTAVSMYPKLWEASGLSYTALVDELIRLALERQAERRATEHTYRSAA